PDVGGDHSPLRYTSLAVSTPSVRGVMSGLRSWRLQTGVRFRLWLAWVRSRREMAFVPMEERRLSRLERKAVRQTGSAQPARRVAKPCDRGVSQVADRGSAP